MLKSTMLQIKRYTWFLRYLYLLIALCPSGCTPILHAPPPSPIVVAFGDNRDWIVLQPMPYQIGRTGLSVIVPAGFVTDYASIPRPLWVMYAPHDRYSRAAVVHDYLYWSQRCTREQADNIFMLAMIYPISICDGI
jgi:hypothetical protein